MGIGILIYLFFICLLNSVEGAQALKGKPNCLWISLSENEIPMSSFPEITTVGWRKETNGTVIYPEFNRQLDTGVFYVIGKGKEGCVISKKLSFELFGTVESIGMCLEFEGRNLYVREVAPFEDSVIFVPYAKSLSQEEEYLSGVMIDLSDYEGSNPLAVGELFLQQYGISESIILDTGFYKGLASIFTGILPFLCFCYFAVTFIRHIMKQKGRPFLIGIYSISSMVVLFILCYVLNFSFKIPETIIPTKWSDFEFWSELLEGYQEQILFLIHNSDSYPYKIYADELYRCGRYSLGALLIFTMFFLKLRGRTNKKTPV